jgi:hypothetical protein
MGLSERHFVILCTLLNLILFQFPKKKVPSFTITCNKSWTYKSNDTLSCNIVSSFTKKFAIRYSICGTDYWQNRTGKKILFTKIDLHELKNKIKNTTF